MNYKGIIIEESLKNSVILKDIKIVETKVERVTEHHKTPWLTTWSLHTVEIPENKSDEIAEKLSKVIDDNPSSWYIDFKNDTYHYIIFPNKIFKVDLANPTLYKDAKAYGISLNIPPYQLDFFPDDSIWKR